MHNFQIICKTDYFSDEGLAGFLQNAIEDVIFTTDRVTNNIENIYGADTPKHSSYMWHLLEVNNALNGDAAYGAPLRDANPVVNDQESVVPKTSGSIFREMNVWFVLMAHFGSELDIATGLPVGPVKDFVESAINNKAFNGLLNKILTKYYDNT